MPSGMQLFNLNGVLAFDSNFATGGVCLDIVFLPGGTVTYSFPEAPISSNPFVIFGAGFINLPWSYSLVNNVPTFTFPDSVAGVTVGMYLK